jgi:hypothetical protein
MRTVSGDLNREETELALGVWLSPAGDRGSGENFNSDHGGILQLPNPTTSEHTGEEQLWDNGIEQRCSGADAHR